MSKLQEITEQITNTLEMNTAGCVNADIIGMNSEFMSVNIEAEFVSNLFPTNGCEVWLHSTIIKKIVDDVSKANDVEVGLYVNDIGINNMDDGVHVYIQFEVTINGDINSKKDYI